MIEKQKPNVSSKPARVSAEEFEVMELLAKYIKTNNINGLKELLIADGSYSIPGKSASIEATKTEFIAYMEKSMKYHFEEKKNSLSHSYSICGGCVYGKGVLKFSPSFLKDLYYFRSISYRVDVKDKKVTTMEVCFKIIEESKFGFDSFSANFQKNQKKKKEAQKPSKFSYINSITLQSIIHKALRFFNDDNYSITLEKLEEFDKISNVPFSNSFTIPELKKDIYEIAGNKEIALKEISKCLVFWKKELHQQITEYLDREIEKATKTL